METKIVVVGAGISGLYAAYLLVQRKYKNVVVLEAQDRVGGRVESVPTREGQYLEIGGQWIHGLGSNPLWKFVQQNEVVFLIGSLLIFFREKNFPLTFGDSCLHGGRSRTKGDFHLLRKQKDTSYTHQRRDVGVL